MSSPALEPNPSHCWSTRRLALVSTLSLVAIITVACGAPEPEATPLLPDEERHEVPPVVDGPPPMPQFANAYECTEDPILDRAPDLPVADTSGVGEAIDRHYPEWRLSTEREIGCRFPLIDGSRPENFWGEAWGSGRAWWIWSGDFNGDGRDDRLALLTSRTAPSSDLLVVFFADGSAAEVGSLGGWGVAVRPEAGTLVGGLDPDERPIRLKGDGIIKIYWEKAAELWYWADGEFRSTTIGG